MFKEGDIVQCHCGSIDCPDPGAYRITNTYYVDESVYEVRLEPFYHDGEPLMSRVSHLESYPGALIEYEVIKI